MADTRRPHDQFQDHVRRLIADMRRRHQGHLESGLHTAMTVLAEDLLAARRRAFGWLGIATALLTVQVCFGETGDHSTPVEFLVLASGTFTPLAMVLGGAHLGCAIAHARTMNRLWALHPDLPLVSPGVSAPARARALLGDRPDLLGKREKAVQAVWSDESSPKDRARARRVLRRADRSLLCLFDDSFKADRDAGFPVWNREGLWWSEAPIPERDHLCRPWTISLCRAVVVRRCACGAISATPGHWLQRNTRGDAVTR